MATLTAAHTEIVHTRPKASTWRKQAKINPRSKIFLSTQRGFFFCRELQSLFGIFQEAQFCE